jgi:hypothetical protein
VAWKSNLKRIQESTKEEILYANRELLSIRRKELESLLSSDKEKYERELSQKGLAFNKNRIWICHLDLLEKVNKLSWIFCRNTESILSLKLDDFVFL